MDSQTFVSIITVIPDDEDKNIAMEKIILFVYEIEKEACVQLIKLYSTDAAKVKALEIARLKMNRLNGLNLYMLLKNIKELQSKSSAIEILKHHIIISTIRLVKIIKMLSDADKVTSLKILVRKIASIEESVFRQIIDSISTSADKLEALKILTPKISNIEDVTAIELISSVSSDTDKVECLQSILYKMKIDHDTIITILKDIHDDSAILQAIKKFIGYRFRVSFYQLLTMVEELHFLSNKTKMNLVKSFPCDTFVDYDIYGGYDGYYNPYYSNRTNHKLDNSNCIYCHRMAQAIDDQTYFLPVAKHLSLEPEYVEKYKPTKVSKPEVETPQCTTQ